MEEKLYASLEQQVRELRARVDLLESALRSRGISLENQTPAAAPATQRAQQPPPPPAFRPASPQPARSLENRIASQWFNRIGIIAVLIGMAWFLKLAIDNHWIGPAPRVLIGILAGIALFAWSERFRKRDYATFSWSLKAIATGILYLSLWAAYSLFHLVPTSVAFVAMVLVTAVNAFMAWTQNSELLALYALIGGYITPLLLSNGQNHQLPLFSYLLVLNLATLALTMLRPWSRLLAAAFAGTLFYAATWSLDFYSGAQFTSTAFFFSIYFLLFAFAPRLVRTTGPLAGRDAFALRILPFATAALGFLGFYLLLDDPTGDWTQSWVAALFAVFYFVLMTQPTHLIQTRLTQAGPSQARRLQDPHPDNASQLQSFDLVIAIAFLAFAIGRAIHHYWWHVRYNGDPTLIHDIGIYAQFTYSACFMLFGAALLLIGFARRSQFLRWQALLALAITIAKVFLIDISQLTEGYRIVSFLGLGALLLAISFIYQRDWLNLRSQPK